MDSATIIAFYTLPFMMFVEDMTFIGYYIFALIIGVSYLQIYYRWMAKDRVSGVPFLKLVVMYNERPFELLMGIKDYRKIEPDQTEGDATIEKQPIYQMWYVRLLKEQEDFEASQGRKWGDLWEKYLKENEPPKKTPQKPAKKSTKKSSKKASKPPKKEGS